MLMISASHLIPADLNENCKLSVSCISVIFILVDAQYLLSAEEGGKISAIHSNIWLTFFINKGDPKNDQDIFYMNHSICLR